MNTKKSSNEFMIFQILGKEYFELLSDSYLQKQMESIIENGNFNDAPYLYHLERLLILTRDIPNFSVLISEMKSQKGSLSKLNGSITEMQFISSLGLNLIFGREYYLLKYLGPYGMAHTINTFESYKDELTDSDTWVSNYKETLSAIMKYNFSFESKTAELLKDICQFDNNPGTVASVDLTFNLKNLDQYPDDIEEFVIEVKDKSPTEKMFEEIREFLHQLLTDKLPKGIYLKNRISEQIYEDLHAYYNSSDKSWKSLEQDDKNVKVFNEIVSEVKGLKKDILKWLTTNENNLEEKKNGNLERPLIYTGFLKLGEIKKKILTINFSTEYGITAGPVYIGGTLSRRTIENEITEKMDQVKASGTIKPYFIAINFQNYTRSELDLREMFYGSNNFSISDFKESWINLKSLYYILKENYQGLVQNFMGVILLRLNKYTQGEKIPLVYPNPFVDGNAKELLDKLVFDRDAPLLTSLIPNYTPHGQYFLSY